MNRKNPLRRVLFFRGRAMGKLKVTKPFAFAHNGYRVIEYAIGDDCPDDAAEVAECEGWAAEAHESAPENKDAAPKRRTKSK